jgi:hypothetical protein
LKTGSPRGCPFLLLDWKLNAISNAHLRRTSSDHRPCSRFLHLPRGSPRSVCLLPRAPAAAHAGIAPRRYSASAQLRVHRARASHPRADRPPPTSRSSTRSSVQSPRKPPSSDMTSPREAGTMTRPYAPPCPASSCCTTAGSIATEPSPLFTALVPRDHGRVSVVPVLYRNATPFRSASGNERSIAVFNRVVPADVAQKAIQPEGKWLALALCYADMVGAGAHALKRAGDEVGLSRAPVATLHLSEASPVREIVFTDRDAPGQYLVWNITLNDKGPRRRGHPGQTLRLRSAGQKSKGPDREAHARRQRTTRKNATRPSRNLKQNPPRNKQAPFF